MESLTPNSPAPGDAAILRLSNCQLCGSDDLLGLGDFNSSNETIEKSLGVTGKSHWCVCAKCNFTFQNPRLSRAYQERWYENSCYRTMSTTEVISQGHISFAPAQLARFYTWLHSAGFDLKQIQNACCLDYGCGIGGALNFLADWNNQIYGVELDRALAEYGNKHYRIQIVPRVADLPANKEFGLIFSHNAIEHIYDPNEFFDFAARRLHRAGIMILVIPAWRYANTSLALDAFNWSHNCIYDHVSLAGFLNKHGFFMASHLYQNPAPDGDWEICCLAYKSTRKNYYVSSVEEVFRELHVNIRHRAADRDANPIKAGDRLSVKA